MFVWEKKLKDARLLMHAEACYKSTMQRVRAFSYGYNLPLPLSGNMLQGSGPCHGLQCDTNQYPVRVVVTPLTLLLLPCSSRSSRMRYALRGHDPHTQWDGPRAGHLNYFKTATVDRLETQGQLKDQNLDVYAFLSHSTHPLLITSLAQNSNFCELSPQKTFESTTHGPPFLVVMAAPRLSRSFHPPFFPNLSISRPLLLVVPKHPYSCNSHSSELTKATHSSFEIALSSYTNSMYKVDVSSHEGIFSARFNGIKIILNRFC